MPTHTLAAAPAKLFLTGEYAVLAGGWAIVAAVDRFVRVHPMAAATGYRVTGADFHASDTLPRAVMRHAGHDEGIVDSLLVDVSELYHEGAKLGLGSSAASTAALLAATAPGTSRAERFSIAFRAHRDIQSGRGSGADIAASTFGGLLAYRLCEPQPPFVALDGVGEVDGARVLDGLAQLAPLPALPDDLRLCAVWTGAPASSTQLIGRVEEALARDPGAVGDALARIASSSERAIEAITRGDGAALLEAFGEGDEAMEALGELTRAPIITTTHRALREHAARLGGCCKASGAGGGDFSLILGREELDWESMLANLPAGAVYIPLEFGEDDVVQSG